MNIGPILSALYCLITYFIAAGTPAVRRIQHISSSSDPAPHRDVGLRRLSGRLSPRSTSGTQRSMTGTSGRSHGDANVNASRIISQKSHGMSQKLPNKVLTYSVA